MIERRLYTLSYESQRFQNGNIVILGKGGGFGSANVIQMQDTDTDVTIKPLPNVYKFPAMSTLNITVEDIVLFVK